MYAIRSYYAVDAKHQHIVEAACKVFFKKGYHPASMREIAKAADMSLGQIYHYISSKDDVLFLIHKHMQTEWYRTLDDARISGYEDPVTRLETALRTSLVFRITSYNVCYTKLLRRLTMNDLLTQER